MLVPLQAAEKGDVILITIDTLRADRLGCYGYRQIETPNIDALARDGVLFADAVVPVPLTLPSHASILTGTYPPYHGVHDFMGKGLDPQHATLAEAFKAGGWKTAAFVSAFVLDSTWGLDQGFDHYFDNFNLEEYQGINPGLIQRRASETIDKALEWLERNQGPAFVWVHLFDPHSDYNPPEPFRSRYRRSPYDGEVAYTDQQLGRLFGYLKQSGRYDNAVIALLSDHGESLGEHGESEHGFFIYDATIKIPFIIKPPARLKLAGRRIATQVSSVDLAPTLLQLAGISSDALPAAQGRRLLSLMSGKPAPVTSTYAESFYPRNSFGWHELKAVRNGRYKYIEAPRPELYDLERDPGERENIYQKQRALAARLRQELAALEQRFSGKSGASAEGVSPEALERLQSLGYIGAGSAAPPPAKGPLADPKDKISIFNLILKAMDAAEAGRFESSNQILAKVIDQDANIYTAHYLVGLNWYKLGDFRRAAQAFERSLALNPGFESALFRLARCYSLLGQQDKAIAGYKETLRLNPRNHQARNNLGISYLQAGRFEEAIAEFKEVVRLRPELSDGYKSLGIAYVQMRQYERAREQLERAVAIFSNDPLARNYLGIAYRNLGRLDDAINQYQEAVRLKPDYAEALLNLSFAYRAKGAEEKAQQALAAACRIKPELCR